MHDTALEISKKFFDTYAKSKNLRIVEIGSQDLNGSLRSTAPLYNEYVGIDFVAGNGVDLVISDPYNLPIEDNSIDIVVCSSVFEHSEFFWLLFEDIQRILRPSGVFYLNVPSNGIFHRFPVDCWRFYPDSGIALQNWARRKGYQTTLIESFTGLQKKGIWNDFIAVFVKHPDYIIRYPERIQDTYPHFSNGMRYGSEILSKPFDEPEDQRNLWKLLKKKVRKITPKFLRF